MSLLEILSSDNVIEIVRNMNDFVVIVKFITQVNKTLKSYLINTIINEYLMLKFLPKYYNLIDWHKDDLCIFRDIISLYQTSNISIYAGSLHNMVKDRCNNLYAWGYNADGRFPSLENRKKCTEPILVDSFLSCSMLIHDIAIKFNHTLILNKCGEVYSCGKNDKGQLSSKLYEQSHLTKMDFPPELRFVKLMAIGSDYSVLVDNKDSIYACGKNNKGQLGLGDTLPRKFLTAVNLQFASRTLHQVQQFEGTIEQIIAGNNYTIFLTSQNELLHQVQSSRSELLNQVQRSRSELYGCGSNHYGQLGFESEGFSTTFVKLNNPTNDRIIKISTCIGHTLLLDCQGNVYGSGLNVTGQLGLGHTDDVRKFTKISNEQMGKIIDISAGGDSSILLNDVGHVYISGSNIKSSVMNGKFRKVDFPSDLILTGKDESEKEIKIIKITAGVEHGLALDMDGNLYGWASDTSVFLNLDTKIRRIGQF